MRRGRGRARQAREEAKPKAFFFARAMDPPPRTWWLAECGKCASCKDRSSVCEAVVRMEVLAGPNQRRLVFLREMSGKATAPQPGVVFVALVEDYVTAGSRVPPVQEAPPQLRQLGQEASFLLVCVLRRYVFDSTPAGSMSRGALQFALSFVAEWVPAYVERTYWLEHEQHMMQLQSPRPHKQPPVKLYLRSFLVAMSIFLEDMAGVMKKGVPRTASSVAAGLLECLSKRHCPSVFVAGLSDAQIRAAKVLRVKTLYSARMQLHFGDMAWQGNLWMESLVRSLSPLIVNAVDTYCTPYNMSMLLSRMLDLLLEHAKQEAGPEAVKAIAARDKVTNRPDELFKIKFNKLRADPNEERLSREYGELINSITTSVLDMVEVSGFFAVLTAVAKPLRLMFQRSIGAALSVALETSVEDDLKKVQFAMQLLFGEKASSEALLFSTTMNGSMATGEAVEDLLSSAFDNLPDLASVEGLLKFEGSLEAKEQFVASFYDAVCATKLEELILLQLSRKSSTIAKLSGDYVKQMLKSLAGSLGLVMRSPDLLQLLIYDYILPQMF